MVAFWFASILVFIWVKDSREESIHSCLENAPGRHCHKLLPAEKLREIGFVPSEEQLEEICPEILLYFRCLRIYADKCPLGESDIVQPIRATQEVAKELCDADSILHQAYVSNFPCYKRLESTGVGPRCSQKAETIYNSYVLYRNEDSDEVEDSDRTRHRYCIEESYKMACISLNVEDKCETSASPTFVDLVNRSKILKRICTPETVEEMSHIFVHFLLTTLEKDHLIQVINTL